MRNLLWIIIAIVIIGGGYWWYTGSTPAPVTAVNENAASTVPVPEQPVASTTVTAPATPAAPSTVTVAYDGKTFSPAAVTLKVGDTVMFKDSSTKNMWVASDEHPTHTQYDGTSRSAHCAAGYTGAKPFDQCSPSTKDFSFTFTKVGKSDFHDHLNPSAHGSITVQ